MTLVSFVVPTRNQAGFIRACLDSCLEQRVTSEVIVMDGASTDRTCEILASYGDRIRWVSERDRGQSDAVNKGIALARGDVIAWINSDDYYPHDRVLAHVVAAFTAMPELDVVYGDGMMVDVDGRPIRAHTGRPIGSARDLVIAPASPLMQPAVFFRKRLFDAVGGLDVSLHYTLDYDLWIRMWATAPKTRYLPRQLASATYHDDAKSVRGMRKQLAEAVVLKRRHADALDLGLADRARMYRGIAELYAYMTAVRLRLKRAV
jgi:glycosyltransferase involved in cell wall biosynthesis